jgi:ribosome-binding factor A
MPSRRIEKVARVIRDSVSETIQLHLNDPRISGLISVTEVDVAPDMKNATVRLSIFATDEKSKPMTMQAILHAAGVFQRHLGQILTGRTCPRLHFELDTKMQKTLQILQLIDKAAQEYKEHDTDDDPCNDDPSSDDNVFGDGNGADRAKP